MKKNEESKDDYLDLKRLAVYSCLSIHTLRDYINDSVNPLPSYMIKRIILVRRSEFDAWIGHFRTDTRKDKIDKMVSEILQDLQLKK